LGGTLLFLAGMIQGNVINDRGQAECTISTLFCMYRREGERQWALILRHQDSVSKIVANSSDIADVAVMSTQSEIYDEP
jgi:hypothetical protein